MSFVRSLRFGLLFGLAATIAGCPSETHPDVTSTDANDVAIDRGSDTATDTPPSDVPAACRTDIECSDGVFCNGAERCAPSAAGANARGCIAANPATPCMSTQTCNEAQAMCQTMCSVAEDADGDGHRAVACGGDDCDDADANRYPGNPEVCGFDATSRMRVNPLHDEDCDATTFANGTTGDGDHDGDGVIDIACCNVDRSGMRNCGIDCQDISPVAGEPPFMTMVDPQNIRPFQTEACNGVDDNCNGMRDEGLPTSLWYRDCDGDGVGDAMDPGGMGCGADQFTLCNGNRAVQTHTDCDDTNRMRSPLLPEICNNADDDCNMLVDDVSTGTVFCHLGETRACTTSCAMPVTGTQSCSATCLGWDQCTATEVCNGCDDDNDGVIDNGQMCARGTSESCTVPTCGTTGIRSCDSSCSWGTCRASEVCNYCDDNGDGNFNEERPLAVITSNGALADCTAHGGTLYGPATSCDAVFDAGSASNFNIEATLLDGTAVPQAGALWLDPSGWTMGWGPVEVYAEMDVTRTTAPGAPPNPWPLGGWAVVIGYGGTPGVGTPQNAGIPTGMAGVGARWNWTTYDSTTPFPLYQGDSFRGFQLLPVGIATLHASGTGSTTSNGEGLLGTAVDFDSTTPTTDTIVEQFRIRYTPEDPTTPATEESVTVTAGTAGNPITYSYPVVRPNAIAIGTTPIVIGITAGTYVDGPFSPGPPGTVGSPVRARIRVMRQVGGTMGPTITYPVTIQRTQLCP